MTDPILTSFELAAEKVEDITDDIYKKYFANCPESEDLLKNVDQGVKGKMVQEVIRLIMVEDYSEENEYLNFEVKFHQSSYAVELHMYSNLLAAVHTVIKDLIGTEWTTEFEHAWTNRLGNLSKELEKRHKLLA